MLMEQNWGYIINKTADGQGGSMQNRLRAQYDSDGPDQPAASAHSDPALHFHCLQLTRRHFHVMAHVQWPVLLHIMWFEQNLSIS